MLGLGLNLSYLLFGNDIPNIITLNGEALTLDGDALTINL